MEQIQITTTTTTDRLRFIRLDWMMIMMFVIFTVSLSSPATLQNSFISISNFYLLPSTSISTITSIGYHITSYSHPVIFSPVVSSSGQSIFLSLVSFGIHILINYHLSLSLTPKLIIAVLLLLVFRSFWSM
jgi:hypothetical protein